MLWTDYFKPEHVEKFPDLHDKFWKATKLAGESKKSVDPAQGQQLLDAIDELAQDLLGDQVLIVGRSLHDRCNEARGARCAGLVVTRPVPIPPRTGT